MPLVVPGINSGGDDKNSQWMNKLMGKKLGDDHDQTVRSLLCCSSSSSSSSSARRGDCRDDLVWPG